MGHAATQDIEKEIAIECCDWNLRVRGFCFIKEGFFSQDKSQNYDTLFVATLSFITIIL